MLALFCLRLAVGLLIALLVLPPATIHPRFYRTHLILVFALAGLALVPVLTADLPAPGGVVLGMGLALLGIVVWSREGARGGRLLIALALFALAIALFPDKTSWRRVLLAAPKQGGTWWLADDLTAAGLLGLALTAMLLGHSYLINPSMTLVPLRRLIAGLGLLLLARGVLAGVSLGLWTAGVARLSLNQEALLWLPLRWLLGLVAPAVLCFMAWRTTQLRNTQSSTGILYVLFVFVCIGELTAQLLLNVTGFFL